MRRGSLREQRFDQRAEIAFAPLPKFGEAEDRRQDRQKRQRA